MEIPPFINSSLTLRMFRDVADNTHNTLAFYYFAFITYFFYRRAYFHKTPLARNIYYIRVSISGPFSVMATVCSK
jgi:hypothetical protein